MSKNNAFEDRLSDDRPANLRVHKATVHNADAKNKVRYNCPIPHCKASLYRLHYFRSHLESVHKKDIALTEDEWRTEINEFLPIVRFHLTNTYPGVNLELLDSFGKKPKESEAEAKAVPPKVNVLSVVTIPPSHTFNPSEERLTKKRTFTENATFTETYSPNEYEVNSSAEQNVTDVASTSERLDVNTEGMTKRRLFGKSETLSENHSSNEGKVNRSAEENDSYEFVSENSISHNWEDTEIASDFKSIQFKSTPQSKHKTIRKTPATATVTSVGTAIASATNIASSIANQSYYSGNSSNESNHNNDELQKSIIVNVMNYRVPVFNTGDWKKQMRDYFVNMAQSLSAENEVVQVLRKDFKCEVCGTFFLTPQHVRIHLLEVHNVPL